MRHLTVFALALLAIAMTAALASGGMASRPHSRVSTSALAQSFATARLATAKYATSLRRAKADGYQIITRAAAAARREVPRVRGRLYLALVSANPSGLFAGTNPLLTAFDER